MKKILSLNFTKIIYTLFIVGTIISIFIVYRDVQSNIAIKFVIAYAIFAFFCLIYFPLITIIKSRNLKRIEIRKRAVKFVTLFILYSILNCAFNYFFRKSNIDLSRCILIPLGLAFGISFLDIALKNR